MIKSYLLVALRNLKKHKTFSIINIFGLAVSMSICLLIILMIADLKSYDAHHENKDRIYRVLSYRQDDTTPYGTTPFPLGKTLNNEYDIFEKVAQLKSWVGGDITFEENTVALSGNFANQDFLDMFSYEFVAGDIQTALQDPYSLVLTEAAANKLFKNENPIGKVVKFNDRGLTNFGISGFRNEMFGDFTITGVIKKTDYKSHFSFDLLASFSTVPTLISQKKLDMDENNWRNITELFTYVMLKEGKSEAELQSTITDIADREYAKFDDFTTAFETQALTAITPSFFINNPMSFRMPLEGIYFLSFLALVIIFSACFNYTNLSLARALTRTKEIGVRKVVGARKKHLFYQFLFEAIIISLFSLCVSVLLLEILKPGFSGLWINKYMSLEFNENVYIYLVFVAFSVLIGLIAGAIPASYLASFKPIQVLKGTKNVRLFKKVNLRKALIVVQFSLSLIFIITATLVYFQMNHMLDAEYGFNKENIVNLELYGSNNEAFINELKTNPEIQTVALEKTIPATGVNNATIVRKENEMQDSLTIAYNYVNQHFLETYGVEMIAGKNFPEIMPEGKEQYILINEKTVEKMGYQNTEDAIGKVVLIERNQKPVEIIGVVKDFRFRLLFDEIGPLMLRYNPEQFFYASIKISGYNIQETLSSIEETWKKHDTIHTFKYEFLDEQLAGSYSLVGDIVSIIGVISFLAISIACLGLLGMVTFATETRLKEIGIRKVLGANVKSVVYTISKGFLKLLLIAIVLATPLAYLVNNLWLENFAYRVDFSVGILFIGAGIMLFLGLITIGSQTIKAGMVNPVKTLRDE